MNCYTHTEVEAIDRCEACVEPFCSDCLVELGGVKYCNACKGAAVNPLPKYTQGCHYSGHVKGAVICAAIGTFMFSIPLAIVSITQASKALQEIKADAKMLGWGLALASIIASVVLLVLAVVGMGGRG
jgi:hypothetical protein